MAPGGSSMSASGQPVRLAGSVLDRSRHVCAFFHNADERYRVILPFIREGLEAGDRVVLVSGESGRQEDLRRLEAAGIDVEAIEWKGELSFLAREDAYLQDGRFDQDKMLRVLEEAFQVGRESGFRLTRFIVDMEWPPGSGPGVEDVVRYQQRIEALRPMYDDVIVSTYDCGKFGAGIVMDILRTHPIVIIGGILQKNPFFVSPADFMHELHERQLSGALETDARELRR
jgi:MEDS: MEthanogen/methylotroph, DcmR Sensory domain